MSPHRTAEIPYRADVDGLRAIAILSVIGFHAFPRSVPSGFVGVDIFFVISGFLISGLILNRLKDGTFSYAEFYQRRIRRLFPALILVLLATWGIGWFILLPSDYAALGWHILGGAAFFANFQTYSEVGYFDALASNKPLLHLWSLGVEEQFYIVFPALLALLWHRRVTMSSLAVIGIASFALNVALVHDHPSFVFFLPMTRFWEFIAGALLQCFYFYDAPLPYPFEPATPLRQNGVAAVGLLLMAAGIIFANPDAFPGWWGALPVFGTVLLISSGPKAWINRTLLANPVMVFIGLISYPLYLWHWPLLVLSRAMVRDGYQEYLRTTAIVSIALAFVLAWLTYRYVEQPVRRTRPAGGAGRIAAGCFALLSAVALLGLVTDRYNGLAFRFPKELLALLAPLTFLPDYPPVDEALNALNAKGPQLVTYGDSHSGHLVPGLRLLQKDRMFRLETIGWDRCSLIHDVRPDLEDTCRALRAHNEERFIALKPDIAVIGAYWREYDHVERLDETIKYLQRLGVPRIVVIGSVPRWRDSAQHELYVGYRKDPQHRIPERSLGYDRATLSVDQQVKDIATGLGAKYISAYDVLCDSPDGCMLRLGNDAKDIVQVDRTHFSAAGSEFFVGHIANQIFDKP